MRYCILPAVLLLLAAACTQTNPADKATLILLNGAVWTADSLQPTAEAIAMRGERILFVGDNAGAQAFASDSTQVINLHGAFVTPGFIEGHGHFSALGRALQNLNLMPTKSWQEIIRLAGEKAAATPKGAWIEGRGWHQEKWNQDAGPVVNGYPFHDALSAATPDHPVVLHHASGHALLANQQAMERAGISRETPDPVGGRIVRDAAGRLTGVFEENAMLLIERPLEMWKNQRSEAQKQADFDQSIRAASADCLSKGICSFQDAGSSFWEIEQYKRLAENGKLDLRLWIMVAQPPVSELDRLAAFPQIGLGDGYCTVRAVKAYLDGALGSYGAWLLEPYNDKPGFTGQNVTPADTLAAIAAACRDRGLQFCVHAIGDRANRETLRIFEQYAPGKDARWRVEHAQHIAPEDIRASHNKAWSPPCRPFIAPVMPPSWKNASAQRAREPARTSGATCSTAAPTSPTAPIPPWKTPTRAPACTQASPANAPTIRSPSIPNKPCRAKKPSCLIPAGTPAPPLKKPKKAASKKGSAPTSPSGPQTYSIAPPIPSCRLQYNTPSSAGKSGSPAKNNRRPDKLNSNRIYM